MSKDVNRSQVFKTTRVRTSLKNDASWIHKSNPDVKEETETRTGQVVQTRPFLPRQSSYVLSALRKFETKTPTEEQIQKDEAHPEQSVVNTNTEEKKEHAETVVDQSNVKDNGEAAEVSVEVRVEESVPNGEGQTHSSTKSNPEPVSPVEPAKPPVGSSAAESKGVKIETAVDPSNVQQNDAEASANVKDLVAEVCAAATEEANDRGAVLDALADSLIPQQEAQTESDPANANLENVKVESDVQLSEGSDEKCPSDQAADETVKVIVAVEEASPENDVIIATPGGEAAPHDRVDSAPDLPAEPVSESPAQPAAETRLESCESGPTEQAAGKTVEAAAEINVETTPEVPVVTAAESESAHQPAAAEAAVETLECKVDSVVPAEPVSQTTAEELVECEVQPSEKAAVEHNIEPAPQVASDHLEELNNKDEAEYVTTADAEVGATEPSETNTINLEEGNSENGHLEKKAEEVVKVVTEIVEESSPAVSDEITVAPGDEAAHQSSVDSVPDLLTKSVSESPTQPPAETVTAESCESGLPVQVAEETVEAAPKLSLDSSPDISKVTVAAEEEMAAQVSVEPVPDVVADILPESSSQSAAGTVECEVESVASAEPVVQTRIEEVVECEVQPPENSAAEQNVESAPQATSGSVEESVANPDAEAHQDTFAYKVIELTDALDEKPIETEVNPEPVKDLKQSEPEETNLSQQLDHSIISEMTKPEEEPQSPKVQYRYREKFCSFCDKGIDGTVRIIFTEPLLNCHPECLKCGMCARALGDLLTPMFLHKEVIQCDGCVAKALKT